MKNSSEKVNISLELANLKGAALCPGGLDIKPNQLIRAGSIVGRRDPLTEFQQKLIIAAISLIHRSGKINSPGTTYTLEFDELLKMCSSNEGNINSYLINEIEKLEKKGIWLYDEAGKKLIRTLWFQSIECTDREIFLQFAEKILPIITNFAPVDAEVQLVKGLRYKGKHTLAVFEIIWRWKNQGLIEYTIPELMRQLSLDYTRYSYGQLKLRVIEPAIEEIYAWDDEIHVRFGPTFSGRRVEGVWFEVKVGEEAKKLRKEYPEFKFSHPDEKLAKD